MELYDVFWVEKNMRDHGEVGEVKMGLKKGVQLCAGKNTMESSELTCFELWDDTYNTHCAYVVRIQSADCLRVTEAGKW